MQLYRKNTEFVQDKQVYCGIDVHDKQWTLAFFCDGEIVETVQTQPYYKALLNRLGHYQSARKISFVYEAGFSGYVLYRQLSKDGYSCVVTPPSRIAKTDQKVKTDKRDASKLAMLLSARLLKEVTVPPIDVEADRSIVRRLKQQVKNQTRAKNHINSFLKLLDIRQPESITNRWTKKHLAWLATITFDQPAHEFTFKQLLNSYYNIRNELKETLLFLRTMSRDPRYAENYKIVTSVKGVGLITGMTFLLELFEISRFSSVNKLSSFIGMTPSQYSTGDHVRLGHITREGNDHLRRVLVESSWTVIRYDPILREKYLRLRARGVNGKKAIVAVARTLAVRLRRCLLDKTPYVVGVN